MLLSARLGSRLDRRLKVITGLVAGGTTLACALVGLAPWALAVLVIAGAGALTVMFRQIDARARAEEALLRAQRLEALGQLTRGVAHDFNNLLTMILGSVQLLQTYPQVRESAETSAGLRDIERAAERAEDLTRAVLSFARPQPLHQHVVDLNEVACAVPAMLAQLVGTDITMTVGRSPKPLRANVDAAQVELALVNLCVNARDAMPSGGRLAIDMRAVMLDAGYARDHAGVAPGPYGRITVTDTGTGIRPADLARIHEPFFTTKEPGKGMGLGLSMVLAFMNQSGGHMRIESEVGRGTAVMLHFPAASEETGAAVEPDVSSEARAHEPALIHGQQPA